MGNPKARQVVLTLEGREASSITAESITFAASVAGTVVDFYIEQKPIIDSNGSHIGGPGDTSIALTSSTFDNEVAFGTLDADLANGDYWIDYITGRGRGKKKDGAVSMTADYEIFSQVIT